MHPASHKSFLALPLEIRNEIYHLLLATPLPRPTRIHASILCTNRTIHAEASGILYGVPTYLAHPSLLTSMPSLPPGKAPVLAPRILPQIQHFSLRVRLDTDPLFTPVSLQRAFTGVRSLEIEVSQATYDGSGYEVLALFGEVRGVGKARVWGSVDEQYATWLARTMEAPIGNQAEPFEKRDVLDTKGRAVELGAR